MRISDWSSDVCSSDLEGFFLNGVAHMRPLTLRQVAEAIGMHESTVSRVTSNKYLSCARGLYELKYFFTFLSCARGLYELKYFFTSGLQSSDGADGDVVEHRHVGTDAEVLDLPADAVQRDPIDIGLVLCGGRAFCYEIIL